MSTQQLLKQLKSKELARLYYLYGDEEYLKQHYLTRIKETAVSDFPEFNRIELDGAGFQLQELLDSVNSFPMWSDRKVICVTDLDASLLKKEFCTSLTQVLGEIPEYCVVVFYDSVLKSGVNNAPLLKIIEACGGMGVKVDHPTQAQLMQWCQKHFASRQKKMTDSDLRYLLEITDTDMLSLNNEIEKLCNGTSAGVVTRADVDALVTRSMDANKYKIIDAFYAKNFQELFDIMDRLHFQNVDDVAIANLFYRAFADVWRGRIALDAGMRQQEFAAAFSMHPFAAGQALKNAAVIKLPFLQAALQLSLELDTKFKSTALDKRNLLTAYIARLVSLYE